jgi:hypothetical protein
VFPNSYFRVHEEGESGITPYLWSTIQLAEIIVSKSTGFYHTRNGKKKSLVPGVSQTLKSRPHKDLEELRS